MSGAIAALDLGGTFIKGCVLDQNANLLTQPICVPVASSAPAGQLTEMLSDAARQICLGQEIAHVAVSTPGPFDYRRGAPMMNVKYASLYGVSLRPILRQAAGLSESVPVSFLSDANAFLLGEHFFGAGRGCTALASITLGTGLGYSVMADGRVLTNENGRPYDVLAVDPHGEDMLETYASGTGLARSYLLASGQSKTAKEMAECGDELSLRLYNEMGRMLAEHLLPRMQKHHVKRLIVGGQVANAMPLFQPPLAAGLPEVEVVQAARPAEAALYGAAAYALEMAQPWEVYQA